MAADGGVVPWIVRNENKRGRLQSVLDSKGQAQRIEEQIQEVTKLPDEVVNFLLGRLNAVSRKITLFETAVDNIQAEFDAVEHKFGMFRSQAITCRAISNP